MGYFGWGGRCCGFEGAKCGGFGISGAIEPKLNTRYTGVWIIKDKMQCLYLDGTLVVRSSTPAPPPIVAVAVARCPVSVTPPRKRSAGTTAVPLPPYFTYTLRMPLLGGTRPLSSQHPLSPNWPIGDSSHVSVPGNPLDKMNDARCWLFIRSTHLKALA